MSTPLADLAAAVGGIVRGDGERLIDRVRTLETAGAGDLSFLTNPRYQEAALASSAGVILVPPGLERLPHDLLITEQPYLALARILRALHPAEALPAGVHPSAIVAPGAQVDPSAHIGPYSCVGEDSVVEAEAVLHAHVVVGRDCRIGRGTVLYPQVSIYAGTLIGRDVIVHSGVVLGADGFGFAQSGAEHVKIPQVGRVVVEDEVEIGSNSTIDRAMLEETRIGQGTKIDDLVMVAHNVRVGERCLLISQAGIAGSSTLGDNVVIAGQSGVSGHVDLGDGVQVASKSAVYKPAEAGARLAGIPAIDSMEWRRQQVRLKRLAALEKRVASLEKRLEEEEGE